VPRRDDYDDEEDRYDDPDARALPPRRGSDDRDDDRPRARRPRDEDEYDDHDDYDDRPRRRRGGRAAARERVSLPAIFLMIIGGLGLAYAVLSITLQVTGNAGPNPFMNPQQANDPAAKAGERVGKVIGGVMIVAWALIVFFGGLQMKNLKNRGFALFSAVWAMLPCSPCCLLGIPFGIWALVVLSDERVKRAF
jgi:hypothetical protein